MHGLMPTAVAITPVLVARIQMVEQTPDGKPSGMTVCSAVEKQSHQKTMADFLPQAEPVASERQAAVRNIVAYQFQTAASKAPSETQP